MIFDYAVDRWTYRIGDLEQAVRLRSGLVIGAFSLGPSPLLKYVYPYISRRKMLAPSPSRAN